MNIFSGLKFIFNDDECATSTHLAPHSKNMKY
jgi:hypothetical protein